MIDLGGARTTSIAVGRTDHKPDVTGAEAGGADLAGRGPTLWPDNLAG